MFRLISPLSSISSARMMLAFSIGHLVVSSSPRSCRRIPTISMWTRRLRRGRCRLPLPACLLKDLIEGNSQLLPACRTWSREVNPAPDQSLQPRSPGHSSGSLSTGRRRMLLELNHCLFLHAGPCHIVCAYLIEGLQARSSLAAVPLLCTHVQVGLAISRTVLCPLVA